jgi:hypothetical protein
VRIFPCRGKSPQRSWFGKPVEFRFKVPPGTPTLIHINTHIIGAT